MSQKYILFKTNQIKSTVANSSPLLPKVAKLLNREGRFEMALHILKKSPWETLSYSDQVGYCHLLQETGHADEALATLCMLEEKGVDLPELFLIKSVILRESGRETEALEAISTAITLHPQNSKLSFYFYTRALIYVDLELYERAIGDFKETITYERKAGYGTSSTWYELGDTYSRLMNIDKALHAFHQAVKDIENAIPMYYYRLAKEYQIKGLLDQAISYMEKAKMLHQQLSSHHDKGIQEYFNRGRYSTFAFRQFYDLAESRCSFLLDLGELYREKLDFDNALEILHKAIEHDPNSEFAYVERGLTYKEMGKHELAISDFLQAWELDPSFTMCPYWIAGCFHAIGEFEQALDYYNRLIDLEPADATFLSERAYTKFELSLFSEAEKDFHHALSLAPDNDDSLIGRSKARMRLGHYEDALKDLLDAKACNPHLEQISFYHFDVAMSLKALHYFLEAVEEMTKALSIDKDNPFLHYKRAELYLDAEEFEKALEDCNKAFELGGDPSDIYWLRGLIHLKLGRTSDAVKDAAEYVWLHPSDAEAHYNHALALLADSEEEEALSNFEKCVSLDPYHEAAYFEMAHIYDHLLDIRDAVECTVKWLLAIRKEWALQDMIDLVEETSLSEEVIDETIVRLKELYHDRPLYS